MSKTVLEEKRVENHKETAKLMTLHASGESGGRVLAGAGLHTHM